MGCPERPLLRRLQAKADDIPNCATPQSAGALPVDERIRRDVVDVEPVDRRGAIRPGTLRERLSVFFDAIALVRFLALAPFARNTNVTAGGLPQAEETLRALTDAANKAAAEVSRASPPNADRLAKARTELGALREERDMLKLARE